MRCRLRHNDMVATDLSKELFNEMLGPTEMQVPRLGRVADVS